MSANHELLFMALSLKGTQRAPFRLQAERLCSGGGLAAGGSRDEEARIWDSTPLSLITRPKWCHDARLLVMIALTVGQDS